jgi:hypothetical protein
MIAVKLIKMVLYCVTCKTFTVHILNRKGLYVCQHSAVKVAAK